MNPRILKSEYKNRLCTALLAAIVLPLAAGAQPSNQESPMKISSTAFADGGEIPARYTYHNQNLSPPLQWKGVPNGTKSLVLIVDDPDAPDPQAPRMTWVHWLLYNIPPDATGLPEGVQTAQLPEGTKEGLNDWEKTGYDGPAPPVGRHRYFHKLYALDTTLDDLHKPTKAQVVAKMKGHVIAQAEWMGTFKCDR